MKIETLKPGKKPVGWSAARKHLSTLDNAALIALVKEMYDAAAWNRDFIHARCRTSTGGGEVLERYRKKIIKQFFSSSLSGVGPLKLGEARKAIRDYRKATGSVPGTAELLMTYVENGVEFTKQYGDIDARFYDSVESVLKELSILLRGDARELYPQFSDRLARVEELSDCVGWGFHDYISDVVGRLDDELGSPKTEGV